VKILLLRHGDAVETGYVDALRPLSSTGEQQARTVAAYLRQSQNIPDTILTSPLTRAVQMALIIRELLNIPSWAPSAHLVPGTDLQALLGELARLDAGRVLLVGHEPHLQTLTSLLTRGDFAGSYDFRKSSLACIEIGAPIVPGAGRLQWLVSADQMKSAV
jgi:phosphohistidine phosphatase